MEKIGAILAQTKEVRAPDGVAAPPVSTADWEQAVGTRIARRTQPLRLERGVLYVRVASAAWANELSLLSTDILSQLAQAGVEVSALRFSVGQLEERTRGPRGKVQRAAAPDAELPGELQPVVDQLEDDNLRDAIREAAAKSLDVRKG